MSASDEQWRIAMNFDSRFSSKEMLRFIDFVGERGIVNESKAKNWKGAAQQFLAILADEEKPDLRSLDLDHLFDRFGNIKRTSMSGSSIKIYGSRFKGALNDFLSWAEDPTNYRHSGRTITAGTDVRSKKSKSSTAKTTPKKPEDQAVSQRENLGQQQIAQLIENRVVVFPIPISGGRIVTINNLPHELTKADAEKISSVIKALAMPEP